MAADFNRIYIDTPMTVNSSGQSLLCFADGKTLSKTRYSILNNYLTLFDIVSSEISVVIGTNVAQVYEFEVRLNQNDTQLTPLDKNEKQVERLIHENLLVFVNGILQAPSEYRVINDNILVFNTAYTTDPNRVFNIIVYASNVSFVRKDIILDKPIPTTRTFANDILPVASTDALDNIILDNPYDVNTTFIFKNGEKVNFSDISSTPSSAEIKLNISNTQIETLEYIQFTSLQTSSYNFNAQAGYLTYGPFDDFDKKLPDTYDVTITFNDQVCLLIDNIREGMLIKEETGYGELIVIGDTFETRSINCKIIQAFQKISYSRNEYYLEVPKATSIIKYLAEYDKKFSFLPEILEIFQRVLLDEIQDSIERLRNIRSISKVDSTNINKLLSLLGFNLNIKELTLKQRKELLEELTEFYRRVGTRDSYNLINILQNDLKLINMEQLFTPHFPQIRGTDKIYDYTDNIEEAGTNYKVGQYLKVSGTDLTGKVTAIEENAETGPIKSFELTTSEGLSELNIDNRPLISGVEANIKVSSSPSIYQYDWNIANSKNYVVGQRLVTADNLYSLVITEVNDNGEIVSFEPEFVTGNANISLNAVQLYLDNQTLSLSVSSSVLDEDEQLVAEFDEKVAGSMQNLTLYRGYYKVVISGAGGSGGAADSSSGNYYDMPATAGYAGEEITTYITISDSETNVSCWVGQGGGATKAKASDKRCYYNEAGKGYNPGELGKGLYWKWFFGWYGVCTPGQGGGSSAIVVKGELLAEAKGGNGGYASSFDNSLATTLRVYDFDTYAEWNAYLSTLGIQLTEKEYISLRNSLSAGGKGGGGGTTRGTGARGGARSGNSFWSEAGQAGYIKIYKIKAKYTTTVTGDLTGIAVNERFSSIGAPTKFSVKYIGKDPNNQAQFEVTPAVGDIPITGEFKLDPLANNTSAVLSISSTIIEYTYNLTFSAVSSLLNAGDTFSTTFDDTEFKYVVSQKNSTDGIYAPIKGPKQIDFQRTVSLEVGTGATINISSSSNDQKSEDREYIDFYTAKELGAELKKEYRIDNIDYGFITEGSKNSPNPWEPGKADIDYLFIIPADAQLVISYGEIKDNILGKWVSWLDWDRNPQWYPTNHVEVELKMPTGINIDNYTNVFTEQFYALSSAVLYIHRLIQSFYIGQDITNANNPAATQAASFGICLAPVYQTEWMVLTSDPSVQIPNYYI